MADGVIFSVTEARRTQTSVEHFERDRRFFRRAVPTRKRYPPPGCSKQNAIVQINIFGTPTGGTFDLTWTIDGSLEILTFNWDDTAAEAKTELATHTKVLSTDLTVTAGPFPDATIEIEFIDTLANTNIRLPTVDITNLTGGTGVGVFVSLAQLGVG